MILSTERANEKKNGYEEVSQASKMKLTHMINEWYIIIIMDRSIDQVID
jgi:hypothetical protein